MLPSSSQRLRVILCCVSAVSILTSLLGAQSTAATPPNAPTLDIPTLIVDQEHRPVDGLRADQLKVKIGSDPLIAPLTIRKEGDDPLSLVILLDDSRDSFHDLAQIADDLAGIADSGFTSADRISVYAFDCSMVRSLDQAAPDAAGLRKAVINALSISTLHGSNGKSACEKTVHLWDNVALAISVLSHTPGRRVVLLVSSGVDGASKYDWNTVQQYALDEGVAIFGLQDQRQADADNFIRSDRSGRVVNTTVNSVQSAHNPINLTLLCDNTGGLTLSATPLLRKQKLAEVMQLIRSRFILTVPANTNVSPSDRRVSVVFPALKSYYYVSPAGPTPSLTTH